MCKGSPHPRLLAKTLYKAKVMIREGTEFFHHFLVFVRVFVSTDMYVLAHKYRVVSLKILGKERIKEGVDIGIEKVKMVHTILFRTEFLSET